MARLLRTALAGLVIALTSACSGCLLDLIAPDECDCHEPAPPDETEFERGLRLARRAECERFHRDLEYAEEQAERQKRGDRSR